MVRNRRTKRGEILTINNHQIDVAKSFKYLGTVINNSNVGNEKIKAKILAANKAYCSLQTNLDINKSTKILK
jgi:hypothetical protein